VPIKCPSSALQVPFLFSSGSVPIQFLFGLTASAKRRKGGQEANEKQTKQAESKEEAYSEPREQAEISRPATLSAYYNHQPMLSENTCYPYTPTVPWHFCEKIFSPWRSYQNRIRFPCSEELPDGREGVNMMHHKEMLVQ